MSDAVKKTKAAFKHIERAGKVIVATEATNHFKQSWRDQGFTDQTIEKWKEVKRRKTGAKGTASSRRRAILVETGALRRSVQTIRRHQWPIIVGTRGLKYARVHNEGLSVQIPGGVRTLYFKVDFATGKSKFSKKAHSNFSQEVNINPYSIKMPKRQFIGYSRKLEKRTRKLLTAEIHKSLK